MAGLMDFFGGSGGDPSAPGGGLMSMYADPRTAGMLGLAQGLLQASAPSRIPVGMGQALGMGMQGAAQGFGNSMALQKQMLQMRAMQGLMGGDMGGQSGQSAQPNPTLAQGTPVAGDANVGAMSGVSAGLGNAAPQMPPQQAPGPAAGTIYGRTPQQLFQQGMLMNMAGIQGGGDLMKVAVEHDPSLALQMPTDISKMGYQGGMTPEEIQAANRGGVAKVNYIAPVNARPGAILRNPLTMQPMAFNPNIPTGGTPVFDASGNVVGVNSIPGAADVTSNMAAAKTAGEGSALPYAGVDAQGNPLPITNRTAAATGNIPLPLRNNNPGAVSPGGSVAQYPDMQTGLQAMDSNLASYAGKPDTGTLGQVISKWVGSPPNAPAYIKDVSTRLGIPANTPVDLTNPAQRQAIATAIMLHENGPGAVFGGGAQQGTSAPAQSGGQIYGSPPLGAATFAQGQVKQMQDRWGALRDQNASAQTVRSQLQNIASLAPGAITGAEADRRSYVNGLLSLVGVPGAQDAKTATDLLDKYSNQIVAKLGQGGLGTDAARSIVSAGNPNAHMTVPAIQEAVRNLDAQYQMPQAKAALLQHYANANDPAGYTKAETTFDRNADPRIWEWQSIQDPAARQKFAASVLKRDPKFGQKIQALEQLGAFR
jgi:hypothetical protein